MCSSLISRSSLTLTCYSRNLYNRLGSLPVCAPLGECTCYPRNRFSCSSWHLSLLCLLLNLSPSVLQELYVPCCKIQYGFLVERKKVQVAYYLKKNVPCYIEVTSSITLSGVSQHKATWDFLMRQFPPSICTWCIFWIIKSFTLQNMNIEILYLKPQKLV